MEPCPIWRPQDAGPEIAAGYGLMALSAGCLGLLFWSLNRRGWSVWR